MKKQILNEEFRRMQLLAGVITENEYKEELKETSLSPEEEEVFDDIVNTLNEGMFDDVIEKIKSYAKKGLMTAAIITSLLASPNFSEAQKQNIKQVAKTEMSASTSKGDAIQSLKAGLKSTNPYVINSKNFDTNNPFTSWNYGAYGGNRKATVGLAISVDKGSSNIKIEMGIDTDKEKSTEYDMIVSLAKSFGFKGETSLSGRVTTFNVSKDKVADVISFMKKSAPILQKSPSKTFDNNFGGIGNAGPAQPGPAKTQGGSVSIR